MRAMTRNLLHHPGSPLAAAGTRVGAPGRGMSPCVSMGISYIGNADVLHAALPHFIPQELRYFVHRRCNSLSPAKRGDCFADRGIKTNNNMEY